MKHTDCCWCCCAKKYQLGGTAGVYCMHTCTYNAFSVRRRRQLMLIFFHCFHVEVCYFLPQVPGRMYRPPPRVEFECQRTKSYCSIIHTSISIIISIMPGASIPSSSAFCLNIILFLPFVLALGSASAYVRLMMSIVLKEPHPPPPMFCVVYIYIYTLIR